MNTNYKKLSRYGSFALYGLVGALVLTSPALAAFTPQYSGSVGAINTPSGGARTDHSCIYNSGMSSTPSLGGGCTGYSTAGGGLLTENGVASSSVDSLGLHAYASQSLTEFFHGPLGEAQAFSNASIQAQDNFHFNISSPSIGLVTFTYSLDGFGAATAFLIIEDTASRRSNSCVLNATGTCTVSLSVDFQSGFSITDNLFVSALSMVGGTDGDNNLVISDYENTAAISAVNFSDSNGSPLQLAYTTDSGYSYPQIAAITVPEPSSWFLLGLGASLMVTRRRWSVNTYR